jgi:hypothetical protein
LKRSTPFSARSARATAQQLVDAADSGVVPEWFSMQEKEAVYKLMK